MSIITKIGKVFEQVEKISSPINKARKEFISLFVSGLIKGRNVQFSEVAAQMDTKVSRESNLRRIQYFFSDYKLNYQQIAMLLVLFVPVRDSYLLSMDRTNWEFGSKDINFLVVSVCVKGVGIPIWFELLEDKQGGNSKQTERISMLRQVIRLLKNKQLILCADREFIGDKWVAFLMKNRIEFYLRFKKNTRLYWQKEEKRADEWLQDKQDLLMDNVYLAGHYLSAGLKKITTKPAKNDQTAKQELLLVVTNSFANKALSTYQNRWAIEVFFQSIKKRGFNIEATHLTDADKLRKLFALCSIAFAICWRIGVWFDEQLKKIKRKNHGYKANSFFRKGLDLIRDALRLNTNIETYLTVIEDTFAYNDLLFK